jgi:hypothetical protein
VAKSHVVSGLVSKRAEMTGLIEYHRKEMGRLAGDLVHLDASIKLFAPDLDVGSLRPRAHRRHNAYFRSGEVPRFILDTLRRTGGPLTSRSIAEHVMSATALASSPAMLAAIQKSLLIALKSLSGKGVVRDGPSAGAAPTWVIA